MRLNFLFDFLRCQDHETFECLVVYLIFGFLFDFFCCNPSLGHIYIHTRDSELVDLSRERDEQIDIRKDHGKCDLDEPRITKRLRCSDSLSYVRKNRIWQQNAIHPPKVDSIGVMTKVQTGTLRQFDIAMA